MGRVLDALAHLAGMTNRNHQLSAGDAQVYGSIDRFTQDPVIDFDLGSA